MNDLDEIQAYFATQLTSRRSLPKDAAASERARTVVKTQGALSAADRLEIYREQFWLRHTSSLVEDYPGVSRILGQAAWQALVEGYLDAHPPRSYTLRDLGLQFPAYVASQGQLEQHALCTDMARLELAYLELFDAADEAPVSPEALASIPEEAWERARIVFQPALRLLQVEYPVATLRRALLEAHAAVPLPAPERHYLLLFRRDLQLFHEPISAAEHALLDALLSGTPLVPACEAALKRVPTAEAAIAENVASWFQSWAARGFVTAIELTT